MSFSTDIRVVDVRIDYEHYPFRSPLKFGGAIVDNMAVLNAHIRVETRSGQVADGVGAMPLGNVWSFPSAQLGFDDTMEAMKDLAERIVPVVAGLVDYDHPVRHALGFEQPILDLAESVTADRGLVEAMPKLCALVVASPFDAALHDAFGKAIGLPSWQALGPDFLSDDLGALLGDAFAGRRIRSIERPRSPRPRQQGRLPAGQPEGLVEPRRELRTSQGDADRRVRRPRQAVRVRV